MCDSTRKRPRPRVARPGDVHGVDCRQPAAAAAVVAFMPARDDHKNAGATHVRQVELLLIPRFVGEGVREDWSGPVARI